jgi:hypothetical protein
MLTIPANNLGMSFQECGYFAKITRFITSFKYFLDFSQIVSILYIFCQNSFVKLISGHAHKKRVWQKYGKSMVKIEYFGNLTRNI